MSVSKPKVSSQKTHSLHPSHLGLELSLTVDVDDLKLVDEDRETKEGHSGNTRGL